METSLSSHRPEVELAARAPRVRARSAEQWQVLKKGLAIGAVLFLLFALLRVAPENHADPRFHGWMGNVPRSVDRVFALATENASRPFLEVPDHLLFFRRNPGMFLFVAELFVRAGATTSLPNQLFAIGLGLAGLLAMGAWIALLFRDQRVALASILFLLITPSWLNESTSIHAGPYNFVFFNACVLSFVLFLRSRRKAWLLATAAFYFLCAMNYWMYYLSTAVLLAAIAWCESVPLTKKQWATLAAAPIAAFTLTAAMTIQSMGGLDNGVYRLGEILVARTVDARLPGSKWYPKKKFLTGTDILRYPLTVNKRVTAHFVAGIPVFLLMLFLGWKATGDRRKTLFLLWTIGAGLSWHAVMIQHVKIHPGSGAYSWFAWMLIFSWSAVSLLDLRANPDPEKLHPRWVNWGLAMMAVFAVYGFAWHYLYRVGVLAWNLLT